MASLHSIPPEVFAQIITDCDRGTLISLALTCRAISWFSLARLWATVRSLSQLLYTLPSDAVGIVQPDLNMHGPREVRVVNVKRELQPADFERYRIYAQFIQEISTLTPLGSDVTPDGWRFFEQSCPDPLPNLRRMSAIMSIHDNNTFVPPFRFLLGPALRNLLLLVYHGQPNPPEVPHPVFPQLLSSLPRISPQLMHLAFHSDAPAPYMAGVLADRLCELRHLTTLTMKTAPLLPRLFASLRSLPSLVSLEMNARHLDYTEGAFGDDVSGEISFPSLSTLVIFADSMKCINRLLELGRPPHLRSLTMTVQGGTTVTPAEFTTLTTTIGSIPSHATLGRLALSIYHFTGITSELDTLLTLPPSAFEPLYALSRLRNFEFQCTHGVVLLDDVAFTQMARAWPDLEDLSLKCRRPHVGRVTLAGVLELARRCRSLKSVRIALADVDHAQCASLLARLKSGSPSAGAPVTSQHAITLDVGRPSIGEEDVSTVAEILTRAIPGLTALRHHWSYVSRGSNRNRPPSHGEMMTHRWDAVMRCIVAARGGGLPPVY